jgi:exodeoxyribonuclease VII small subunit
MSDEQDLSFDAALERLEEVVARMEGGSVGLEEAVGLFEKGQSYLAICTARLEAIERRIEELAADQAEPDGGSTPF